MSIRLSEVEAWEFLAGGHTGILTTLRRDGSVHNTVVNAGVIHHPVTGEPVAAFVGRAGTLKLQHLRATPSATLCWRAGWAWCTAEGLAQLVGPDDPHLEVAPATLPALLRAIYTAAGGGEHDTGRRKARRRSADPVGERTYSDRRQSQRKGRRG